MLDLREYQSLGEALRAALERWLDEVCLIEADREREKARFTYKQFKEVALPLASALQDAGFQSGTRAAIIDQSVEMADLRLCNFLCGGTLSRWITRLPLHEQTSALAHSRAEFLIVEHHLWRAIMQADEFKNRACAWARNGSAERS